MEDSYFWSNKKFYTVLKTEDYEKEYFVHGSIYTDAYFLS